MKKTTLTTFALSLTLLGGSGAISANESQTALPKEALTLGTAVEYALNANPDVLKAREQIGEFDELVRQARAEALPRLDGTLSILTNRDPGLRNSPQFSRLVESENSFIPPEALLPYKFTNYVWRFDFEQPVYSFGRVSNAMKAAKDELQGVRLDVQEVENRVSRDVARACYGFLLAKKRLEVLESERAARERQLENVRNRFELEDATRLDLLRAQVTLANLRPEILAAENDVQIGVAVVNDALGRPVDAPLDIDVPLVLPEEVPRIGSPSELMMQAARNRPEFIRFSVDRRVLEDRVGVTRANTLPEISAMGSVGINTFGLENLSSFGFRSWAVGLSVDWTVFDGYRTSAEIGSLRSRVSQSTMDERAFRSELALELERATGTWRRALESYDVARITVEQAREAERVAEESFQWGAATTLDLLESARALREAEFNVAQAAHDALVALAEIKYLMGFRADAADAVVDSTGSSLERKPVHGELP